MGENTNYVIAIAALLVTLFCFIWRKKNQEKKDAKSVFHGHALNQHSSNEEMAKYHEKENDILLRIAQAEREFNAKLDTKISLLNVLIEKADNKIAELKDLQTHGKRPIEDNTKKELPKQEQLQNKIKQLHEAGMTSSEIASHLKMMEGEVNLTLSILKKKQDG